MHAVGYTLLTDGIDKYEAWERCREDKEYERGLLLRMRGFLHYRPGSLVLVGGDPGIGKSTLLLQVCRNLAENGSSVLYISGEESLRQIKLRANRIGTFNENLQLLCETNLDTVREVMERKKPDVAIVDSIQTMFDEEIGSVPGSVSQVRESTNCLLYTSRCV